MTLVELCEKKQVTNIVSKIAKDEGVSEQYLREEVVAGRVAIPANKNRKIFRR